MKVSTRVDYAGIPFDVVGDFAPPEPSVGFAGGFELSRISVYGSWHDLTALLSEEQVEKIERLAAEKLIFQ